MQQLSQSSKFSIYLYAFSLLSWHHHPRNHKTRYSGICGRRITKYLGNNSKCIPNKRGSELHTAKCSSVAQLLPSIGPSLEMCILGVNVLLPTYYTSVDRAPTRINRQEKRASWPGQKSSHQKSLHKVAHRIYFQGTVLVTIQKHMGRYGVESELNQVKTWSIVMERFQVIH